MTCFRTHIHIWWRHWHITQLYLLSYSCLVSVVIGSSCKVTFDLIYTSHLCDKGAHVKYCYMFTLKAINVFFLDFCSYLCRFHGGSLLKAANL